MKNNCLLNRMIICSFLSGILLLGSSCKKDDDEPKADLVVYTNVALSGAQESPTVSTSATGTFNGSYDKTSNTFSYTIAYSGLTPTAMHFHKADVGVSGPVDQDIAGPYTSGMTGSVKITDAQETDLLAGKWYVNIHTTTNPGGEVRGQVVTDNMTVYSIGLSGANEVPAVTTTSTGRFYGLYNKTSKKLSYVISYTNLVPTAMHFHKAAAGANGAVEIDIAGPYSSGMTGSVTLSAAQETDLMAGLWYVNAHTTLNAGGEVRGQVIK